MTKRQKKEALLIAAETVFSYSCNAIMFHQPGPNPSPMYVDLAKEYSKFYQFKKNGATASQGAPFHIVKDSMDSAYTKSPQALLARQLALLFYAESL